MSKVIFVCSGNTCRSPLAEAVARDRYPGWTFVSAGLSAVTGHPASSGTCDMARDRGLDVDSHRSRRLDADLAAGAWWVIGMTADHVHGIRIALPDHPGAIGKLGRPGVALAVDDDPVEGEDVDDPWHNRTELAYDLMAEQVDRLLTAWDPIFREDPR